MPRPHPGCCSRRPGLAVLLLAPLLALAACDTAEERAEGHYERALALIEAGDTERARVEFRNVFRLNGAHTEARLAFARLLREEGDVRGAIGHYLRLVEQDRNHAEGHRDLAELALEIQDLETAATHADRAYALAPAEPRVRALKAAVDFYRGEREAARAMAEAVLAEDPASVPAHMVVVAERMAAGDPAAARALSEAAIAAVPHDEGLHVAHLAVLEQIGDVAAVGAQLKRMAELFPDNPGVSQALVRWHLAAGDPAAAEAELRALAARSPDAPEGHLRVVEFRLAHAGPEAARAELERLIAAADDPLPYRRALAELDFAEGRTEAAIAALRALAEAPLGADDRHDVQIALAAMLWATGAAAESEALVDAVLAADRTHVEALKLSARRHVAADRPEAAIRDLRTALGQAPRDPEIMTIMAMAHEREGARALMGERLALAVETSGFGAAESIRYARFLTEEGRAGAAEGVLVDALRRAPQHPALLTALGEHHLARGDWRRVGEVARILRDTDDPEAAAAAAELELARLRGEGRLEETIALLEELAAAETGAGAARLELVRARVAAGDLAAAEAEVAAILEADPASLPGRMMQAGLHLLGNDPEAAEALYRAIIADHPARAEPYQALFALLSGLGRDADAAAVLAAGIEATDGDGALLFIEAGRREVAGDFEGAIALYETLYARDSANPVIANNLASLISTHRDDAESLERAFQIARRLRDAEVPHFQDTYGWILARRGDAEAALAYLEPAAAALGHDPLVQYHLGMTYLALERWEDARAALARAVAVAGEASTLPQIEAARARIAEIDARPAVPAEGG